MNFDLRCNQKAIFGGSKLAKVRKSMQWKHHNLLASYVCNYSGTLIISTYIPGIVNTLIQQVLNVQSMYIHVYMYTYMW